MTLEEFNESMRQTISVELYDCFPTDYNWKQYVCLAEGWSIDELYERYSDYLETIKTAVLQNGTAISSSNLSMLAEDILGNLLLQGLCKKES